MPTIKCLIITTILALGVYAAPTINLDEPAAEQTLEIRTTVSTNRDGFPSGETLQLPANATGDPSGFPSGELLEARGAPRRMFHIPEGQKNGIYNVHFDDDGKEVHERLGSLSKPPQNRPNIVSEKGPRDVSSLQTREEIGKNCPENGAVLDPQEVTRAARNLGKACDGGGSSFIKERSAQYALSGNAIVFMCNHMYQGWWGKSNARGCSSTEVSSNIEWLQGKDQCNLREGWRVHKEDSKYYYSFGYTKAGNGFCSYVK